MRVVLGLVVALCLSAPVSAQTYLSSTTNSAAINATQTSFTVASATGIAAGGALYVNRELMSVRSVSGTVVTVVRGQSGTVANAHGASQTLIVIPSAAVPSVVSANDPSPLNGFGACSRTEHRYLPIINVTNGNVWLCRPSGSSTGIWMGTNAAPLTYNSLLLNLS